MDVEFVEPSIWPSRCSAAAVTVVISVAEDSRSGRFSVMKRYPC